jgi:hypothetical protein
MPTTFSGSVRGQSASSHHAENGIIADWKHQSFGEARCRPAAESQSEMMEDAVQPAGPA